MHTVIVILVGFVVLGVCLASGRYVAGLPGVATAAMTFVLLWFLGATTNLIVGVRKAGYSVSEELPIFLLVFAIPSAVAILIWWRVRH